MRAGWGVGIGVATLLLLGGSRAATAEEAVRVVILPIVVHSGAPDPAYVSRGIADMLSSRLEQDGRALALRVDDPARATTRIATALEAGRERKADFVLFGAFTQFGDGASLDLHCIPVTDDEAEAAAARRIFIQSGAVGEIILKLDEIVARVSSYVHGGPVPAALAEGAPAAAPATGVDLRGLVDRLEALEARVYGGESPVAEAAPGS